MKPRELFSVRLRELREKSSLTQTQLADQISADNVQISRYETGAIAPSVDSLVKLADVFGCSIDYLLGRSDLPRIGVLGSDDLKPDERRGIQAIRERDIQSTFVILSLLYATPVLPRSSAEVEKELRQVRMEERVRRKR